MKNSKRFLCGLLGATMVLSLALTSCSKSEPSGTPPANDTSKPVSAPASENKSELKGDLVYWSNWNQTETQGLVLTDAIAEFQKENPGVKINVVWNGRENKKVLLPALQSGQQIDLFEQNCDLVLGALGDYLLDCTPYYDKVYPTTDGKAYKDAVMPATVELAKTLKPGGIYGVPYQPTMFAFMYNKEHFEKAGIEKTPENWQEFMDTCQKLKDAGYTPITCDDSYIYMMFGMHLTRLKGQDWLEKCVNDKTGESWKDPAVLQALKDYNELVKKGYFSKNVTSNKYPAGQQEIAMGEVSMYWNGTWLVNEVMSTTGPDFKWGQFTYPVLDAAASDATDVQYNCQIMGINKDTKSPEAAFAFAAYITTGKWDLQLAKDTYGVPVGNNSDWPAPLSDAKKLFENSKSRIYNGTALSKNSEKLPIVQENFVKVLSGAITPEQAVDALSK